MKAKFHLCNNCNHEIFFHPLEIGKEEYNNCCKNKCDCPLTRDMVVRLVFFQSLIDMTANSVQTFITKGKIIK
jgi:hypothetical protein